MVFSYQYKYTSKEWQDEMNLNLYDHGARNYDPATGRWNVIDAFARMYVGVSPYNYALNNPMVFTDPNGHFPQWGYRYGNIKGFEHLAQADGGVSASGGGFGNTWSFAGTNDKGEAQYQNNVTGGITNDWERAVSETMMAYGDTMLSFGFINCPECNNKKILLFAVQAIAINSGIALANEKINRIGLLSSEQYMESQDLFFSAEEPIPIEGLNYSEKQPLYYYYTLSDKNKYNFKQEFSIHGDCQATIYIQKTQADINISSMHIGPGYNVSKAIDFYNTKGVLIANLTFDRSRPNLARSFLNYFFWVPRRQAQNATLMNYRLTHP